MGGVHPHIRIAKVGIFYSYTSTVRDATAVSFMTSESSGIRQQNSSLTNDNRKTA